YPFCWRCQSPLIYFAKNSWFLKTTAVKNQMISENKKIGWHPEFIRDGRFGEWLSENVDWAISRERYWGTPLPIWQCAKCANQKVIGSLAKLDEFAPERSARIFIMRHGQADHNVKGIIGPATPERDYDNHLTKKGIAEVKKAAAGLKKEKIDLVISSPLNRARQTAEILSKNLGAKTEINNNIYDIDAGDFHGRSVREEHKEFPFERKLREPFPNGESLRDTRSRMMMELRRIAKNNRGKNIVIVSHGDPLWMLNAALEGLPEKDYKTSWYPKTGEAKELELHNWPYNRAGELDLHRPYIDLIDLACAKCGGKMKRVKEVADVWFDSGCVPFAQDHYPFDKKIALQYPADYIAEGIDQTRGWFYTLLAVSSLLKLPAPYKNVLVLGLVLDEKGEKMSKSRGNAAEPLPLFEKYGADAVRWYFYTVNQPWDEKLFKESDIAEASRRFMNIFWNSFVYWRTYKDKGSVLKKKPKLLINKWLDIRLNQVGYDATEALEKFDIVRAARMIENFVAEDLSRWYVRRSRRRFQRPKNQAELAGVSTVLSEVLTNLAKIMASFTPFVSEII
ncbi:MAG: class I tRNA ligase family protein, partial [Candidatus Niyogibacteria bacterium]|nr:class I tRNA ligase family protein [Candidatus Niyogibacteria bacterium]